MLRRRVVKTDAESTVLKIHKRALRAAMRAAGGDADYAAKTLGMTTKELLLLLDGEAATMWSAEAPGMMARISSLELPGVRRETDD